MPNRPFFIRNQQSSRFQQLDLLLVRQWCPDNLAAAAAASGAVFLDLSSSVESAPGRKDRDKVLAAVAAARTVGADPSFLS